MTSVSVILAPYYLGHRDVGMGRGPTHLVNGGVAGALRDAGFEASVSTVEFAGPVQHEIGAGFKVNGLLAEQVRAAVGTHRFPIVLAGNCNSCLGTLAGLAADDLGIVWFDAHGDFNTPDTSASGFFDGMALNIAIGGSWAAPARALAGFQPVSADRVALAGVRALDPGEEQLVHRWGLQCVPFQEIRTKGVAGAMDPCLDALAARTSEVYVHVDLDVLDPTLVPANEYSPTGGLRPEELFQALAMVGERYRVRAGALASYNPDGDPDGKALAVAVDVVKLLATIGTNER